MALKIVLGNKNYSSWSLRPWLALEQTGAPYEEAVIPLDRPDTKERIAKLSPSGRVPALIDEDLTIWDSLAICEYLAEKFPTAGLWPAERAARAVARSVSAEMHSGFAALRTACPMNIGASLPDHAHSDEVKADIARIVAIWSDCRKRFGAGGPYLFGKLSIADAMYAPVVTRFRTYGIALEGESVAYAQAIWDLPAMKKWVEAAHAPSRGSTPSTTCRSRTGSSRKARLAVRRFREHRVNRAAQRLRPTRSCAEGGMQAHPDPPRRGHDLLERDEGERLQLGVAVVVRATVDVGLQRVAIAT